MVKNSGLISEQSSHRYCNLSDNYFLESEFDADSLIVALNNSIKPEIESQLQVADSFVKNDKFQNQKYNILFFPIQNIEGKHVAYLVSYEKDDFISNIVEFTVVLLLAIFLVAILFYQLSKKNNVLKIERDKLKNIFETMDDGVYIVNQEFDIEYVNPKLTKDFGPYTGEKCYKYFHERDEVCPWCKNEEVFAGKTVQWEFFVPQNNKTYDLVDTPLKNYDGTFSKLEILRDITDRKISEKVLLESENRTTSLINATTEMAFLADSNGKLLMVNDALAKNFKKERDELIGMEMSQLISGEIIDKRNDKLKSVFESKKPLKWSDSRAGKSFENSVYPVLDSDGNVKQIAGYIKDITAQKKAEEALKESEEKYRTLIEDVLDTSEIATFILDSDFKVAWINKATEKYFGLKREDVIGKDKRQLIQSQIKDIFEDSENFINKVFATYNNNNYVENFECHVLQGKEREERWLSHWSQPVYSGFYKNGRIEHYYDLTELKKVEFALKESEEQFKSLMQQSPFVIELYNLEGLQVSVNKAYEELWGFSADTTLNKFNVLKSKEVEDSGLMAFVKRAYAGETVNPPEYQFDPAGDSESKGFGRVRWLSTRLYPLEDKSGNVKNIVIVHQDVSERKWAEEELKKLSTAVKQSANIVVLTDIRGKIEYINPKFTEVTGYKEEEVIGQNPRILNGGSLSKEFYIELWNTITNGEIWEGDFHNKTKDGKHYWEHAIITPIKDDNGTTTHYLGIKEDITEKKKTDQEIKNANIILKKNAVELANLNISLEKSKKELLESNANKDKFFSIISHDLKGPFNGILGITDMLVSDYDKLTSEEVKEMIQVLRNSSLKVFDLLKGYLNGQKHKPIGWSMNLIILISILQVLK